MRWAGKRRHRRDATRRDAQRYRRHAQLAHLRGAGRGEGALESDRALRGLHPEREDDERRSDALQVRSGIVRC